MINEVAAAGSGGPDRAERARAEFLEFLAAARPAALAADALAYLLRTEPPRPVDQEEVVELVAAWADERSAVSHQAVSVLFVTALRKILDAHAASPIAGFDPRAFLGGVGLALARHCPSSEQGGYQAALRDLHEPAERARSRPAPEAATGDTIEIRGVRMTVRHAQEVAVSRLEHEAYMTDADFEAAFADLRAALVTRVGAAIVTLLTRVACSAARTFNTGRVRQAGRLAEYLNESFERLAIGAEPRLEVKFAVGPSDLNEGLLAKALGDPEQRPWAAHLVRLVGYLGPTEALEALGRENRRERRRLLLAAVEAHGAAAHPVVVEALAAAQPAGQKWYVTRNCLYLLSRLEAADDAARRRTVELVGRYVTHDQPQLRTAALAALRHIGGREVIPYVVRALDPAAYAPGSIDDTDTLKRFLYTAMEALVETGNEAATAIVAEFATGARGGEFDLGQALRDEACAALLHAKGPLPRRAAVVIANQLGQICGRRFKLVTGSLSFGLDAHACRMLSALIRNSSEAECREVLEHPVLTKVLARTSGELA